MLRCSSLSLRKYPMLQCCNTKYDTSNVLAKRTQSYWNIQGRSTTESHLPNRFQDRRSCRPAGTPIHEYQRKCEQWRHDIIKEHIELAFRISKPCLFEEGDNEWLTASGQNIEGGAREGSKIGRMLLLLRKEDHPLCVACRSWFCSGLFGWNTSRM